MPVFSENQRPSGADKKLSAVKPEWFTGVVQINAFGTKHVNVPSQCGGGRFAVSLTPADHVAVDVSRCRTGAVVFVREDGARFVQDTERKLLLIKDM